MSMPPTLRTGVYRLDIRKYNSDIAHLYEHMLIETFSNQLIELGYSPYLYGWVGGDTFRNVMFIDYGFYSPDIEPIFESFMASHKRIDLSLLNNEVNRLESESNSLVVMPDKDAVITVLKSLDKESIVNINEINDIHQISEAAEQVDAELFHEMRSKKMFRDVTIGCGMQNASLEEKAIFTRLTPIIYDAISHDLDQRGMYEKNTSFPKDRSEYDALYITAVYTIKRGTLTSHQIKKTVQKSLKKIELASHQAELENYLNGFLSTPTWNDIPIEFYRHSGMLVSRKQIAELFSPVSAQAVIDKLEVAVRSTQKGDWS